MRTICERVVGPNGWEIITRPRPGLTPYPTSLTENAIAFPLCKQINRNRILDTINKLYYS